MIFFFNDTATTEIYTLSLHDALPIFSSPRNHPSRGRAWYDERSPVRRTEVLPEPSLSTPSVSADEIASSVADRKSTRLNSSHANISYAVFCLKKKNTEALTVLQ